VDSKTRLGAKLLMLDVLESTSLTLRELAQDGEPEGTVVVAEEQRAGRGRLGRGWSSPKGGLWFSVLLRPPVLPPEAPKLTLLAGVAVARALKNTLGLDARLKWPNDVLVQGKKLCGILSESLCGDKVDYVILGIGINANFLLSALPEELRRSAITVREVLQRSVDRHALLRAILNELERLYAPFCAGDRTSVLEQWKALSDTPGKRVRVETTTGVVEGEAVDIDGDGALVVRTAEGTVTVASGDCVHLKA
jgi:BirA family biotin operon repressor/biotin-[acetyl-CoA-carboxylase] ligase